MAESMPDIFRRAVLHVKSGSIWLAMQKGAGKRGLSRIGKPVIWGSAAVILILLLTCPGYRPAEPAREGWAVVQKRDFSVEIVESGDVEAFSQRLISAPQAQSDQMQVIGLVPEGSIVRPGDFLIQFDVSQLETNLALAEQDLAASLADLERIRAQQSLTNSSQENTLRLTEYSREQSRLQLDAQQYESEAKKEQARLALKQADMDLNRVTEQIRYQQIIHSSQMTLLETAIRKQRNELKSLREQISRQKILAPIGGMVVYQEVGSWQDRERLRIGYKARPGEPLISIPDLSRMQVKLYLNEIDRSEIEPGLQARVILDAYPDTVFNGRVRELANLAQNVGEESDLKGFVVYVDLDGSDFRLKPGLSARVRIELTRVADAWVVPVGTIYERDGKPVVFPYGKSKPIPVALGPRSDAYAVVQGVLKTGLKLFWEPPDNAAKPLGFADEKKRTDEANRLLVESFADFEKRGILYDYSRTLPAAEEKKEEASGMREGGRRSGVTAPQHQGGFRAEGRIPGSGDRQASDRQMITDPRNMQERGRRSREAEFIRSMPGDNSGARTKREPSLSRRAAQDTSVQRKPGFAGEFRVGPDSTRMPFPAGGFGHRARMQQDSSRGGFPPGFPGIGGETAPDSLRRRFRRDGFGRARGRPPDSVIQRMRERRMQPPGRMREGTEGSRQPEPPAETGGK